MKIYIYVEDLSSMKSFINEARKIGFMKGIDFNKISFKESDFPMRLPVDIEAFLKLTANPVVKKIFGKKIETTLENYLIKEAGR